MRTQRKIPEELKQEYVGILKRRGEHGLYKRAIGDFFIRTRDVQHPEIELLDISEGFFVLHRKTGEEAFLTIGRILRKAAHYLYRELLRNGHNSETNMRFLNLVK